MYKGFWQDLRLPVIGLAPMDGVTDAAFRYIVAKYGRPDLIITEFTSVEGLRAGAERLLDDFYYSPDEHPVVAQLFGSDPKAFYLGAVVVAALGFDGIDINMGCPAKNIAEKGAGAALIRDPERAKEIVQQARAGAQAWANGLTLEEAGVPDNLITRINERRQQLGLLNTERKELPISVKTRLGYDQIIVEEWVQHLLEVEPVNISLHGRTLKQQYTGLADWEAIGRAAHLIHTSSPITVLGNGDITDLEDAKHKIATYGVDGVLIGRSTFGNPWLFQNHEVSFNTRMGTALEHARYLHQIFAGRGFVRIRKHLLDYCKGIEGAKELRLQLMKVNTLSEVEEILKDYLILSN